MTEVTVDGERFDTLARVLSASDTRRGALGVLGGFVGVAGVLVAPLSARRRKHNNRNRKRKRRGKGKGGNQSQQGPNPQGGGSQPRGSVCDGAGTRDCDLAQAAPGQDLSRCNFAGAGLVGVALNGIAATRAIFAGAHTLGADLASANLDGACFANASLRSANLRGANAAAADFSKADLCGADLRGTNISSTQIAATSVCCSTLLPDGSSAAPCPAGRTCCHHGCADLLSDSAHCGACGNTCARGQICCGGACVAQGTGSLCGLGGPECLPDTQDLQAAIDGTPEYGTLQLCAGTWTLLDTVLIDKSVTIIGAASPGTSTITAPEQNAALGLQLIGIRSSARVSMQNVQLNAGFAEQGAGIFNQGNLTLADCEMSNNEAVLGAGIYNEGTLHLIRGKVAGNATANIYNQNDPGTIGAGGLYNDEGTVLAEGTAFTGNEGGHFGDPGNEAAGYGGAIYNYFGTVTLQAGVQIENNRANYEGGGVYNEGGALYAYSSTLTGNSAGEASGTTGYGGGVYLNGGSILFDAASKVTGNSVLDGGEGGGVYLEDNAINRRISSVTIPRNVVTGNTPDDVACNPYAANDGYCG